MEPRDQKISNFISSVELKTNYIMSEFSDFTDGIRMLILMERKKEAGPNKEEHRMLVTRFTFNPEEFKRGVQELLILKLLHPTARMYSSVNPRNLKKIMRNIELGLLDAHYTDEEQRFFTYKKLIRAPRHYVMQQSVKDDSLFIIDVDDIEGRDVCGEALQMCEDLGITIIKNYKTKNGWHLVTKPFNPNLWKHESEIKKDALILLDY